MKNLPRYRLPLLIKIFSKLIALSANALAAIIPNILLDFVVTQIMLMNDIRLTLVILLIGMTTGTFYTPPSVGLLFLHLRLHSVLPLLALFALAVSAHNIQGASPKKLALPNTTMTGFMRSFLMSVFPLTSI
jgi:hypothetical protein